MKDKSEASVLMSLDPEAAINWNSFESPLITEKLKVLTNFR